MNSTILTLAFFFMIINLAFGAEEDADPRVFEGDIVLSTYERDHLDEFLNGTLYTAGLTRNALIHGKSGNKWTRGVVPYVYANGHFRYQSQRNIINQAMAEYHRKTCIRFKPRTSERNYIQFVEGGGCSSQVGMVGNMQRVTLGRGCVNFGTVIHELMHAVGFWHEQSRADRDDYVWIYGNNISPGMKYNFKKYDFNKITHLGTPYDYCSVMHYPRNAFSMNGRDTIVPKRRTNCVLGSKTGFSANDIKKINKLYKCSGGGTKPTPKPTPTGTCVDDNTSCPGWAQSGECKKNPDYMLKSCRKSCNQCSTTSSKCVDQNTQCRQWASVGECSKNPAYMHKNCAKSCNTCGTTTSSCRDIKDQCGLWANGGYCSNRTYKDYMAKNCKRSCGIC